MRKYKRIEFALLVFAAGISSASGRGMYGSGLMAPANPSVPPSLTSNPRVIGSAPLPPHQQPTRTEDPSSASDLAPNAADLKLDQRLDICRGC